MVVEMVAAMAVLSDGMWVGRMAVTMVVRRAVWWAALTVVTKVGQMAKMMVD